LPSQPRRAGGAPIAGRSTFVVTEHVDYLTAERRARYERIRGRLEGLAGRPVDAVHYLDAEDFSGSDSVVLSGSGAPWSAHDPAALDRLGEVVAAFERPVLGICAGMQLLAGWTGGEVRPMAERGEDPERGFLSVEVVDDSDLLAGLPRNATVFQDHYEEVAVLPPAFVVLARGDRSPIQAIAWRERGWWATQFHPEWADDDHPDGDRVLANFFGLALAAQ
jgi:GMP synthase-like glutamine amidotransferase